MKLRIYAQNPKTHTLIVCRAEENHLTYPTKLWVCQPNANDTPEQALKRGFKGDYLCGMVDSNVELTEEDIAETFKQIDDMIIEFI